MDKDLLTKAVSIALSITRAEQMIAEAAQHTDTPLTLYTALSTPLLPIARVVSLLELKSTTELYVRLERIGLLTSCLANGCVAPMAVFALVRNVDMARLAAQTVAAAVADRL